MKRHERSPPAFDVVPASQRRRLSFSHSDLSNPIHVADLYEQCLDQVLSGFHPVSRDCAIRLAAIHCYIQFGHFHDGVEYSIRAYKLLPKEYTHGKNVHSREHEKNIIEQYRNLSFADAMGAKRKYCDICRNLPTYGTIFFDVKEPQGNKLVPRLFGVNKECVMSVDKKSKVVRKSWPLEQLRKWAAGPTTFNIDFGDYQDGYYSVQTTEAEKIKLLIAEFVDIIIWKKKITDSWGLEGDEGAIMIEDFVLRAKSVPLSVGDVVGEEEMVPKQQKAMSPSPFVPLSNQQKFPPPDHRLQFPRRISNSSAPFPPPMDLPTAPIRTASEPKQPKQPIISQMPPGFEQYDQLPFQQQPAPSLPVATQMPLPPPMLQSSTQIQVIGASPPTVPQPSSYFAVPPLQQPSPTQQPTSPITPSQSVPSPPVSQSLPPSLTSSMHQKYQSTVSPASMSILTEQEIVYEISVKNGQARRSFEQYYSQNRNLHGLSSAIEQSGRRVRQSAANLGAQQQFGRLSLTEEQRQMAIQLGEDSIRHRAVVFLASVAQAIEWTSECQAHPKYGHAQVAVGQAADSLCELVQCFVELCAIRQDAQFNIAHCSPLVHALCDAFSDFLSKLHPESGEKRSAFLSSASSVGECSFGLLNALNDEDEAMEDQHFYLAMNEAIQRVADGTANLVIQAKHLPSMPGDSHNERVIGAATTVALFTSELIALSRVLASIMAHPACQKRVQEAVERVRAATAELLERAKASAFNHFAITGSAEHYAQMQKNALMAEMALQQMLEQTQA